jgi:hypothetical protein
VLKHYGGQRSGLFVRAIDVMTWALGPLQK